MVSAATGLHANLCTWLNLALKLGYPTTALQPFAPRRALGPINAMYLEDLLRQVHTHTRKLHVTSPHSVTGDSHTSSLALDAVRSGEGSIPLFRVDSSHSSSTSLRLPLDPVDTLGQGFALAEIRVRITGKTKSVESHRQFNRRKAREVTIIGRAPQAITRFLPSLAVGVLQPTEVRCGVC